MDFILSMDEVPFPVRAFFLSMSERSLIRTLEGFCEGIGAGFNGTLCEFPGEIEEGEEPFTGVRFGIFEEEVVISADEFYRIVSTACDIHARNHPEAAGRVDALRKDLASKLNVRHDPVAQDQV